MGYMMDIEWVYYILDIYWVSVSKDYIIKEQNRCGMIDGLGSYKFPTNIY